MNLRGDLTCSTAPRQNTQLLADLAGAEPTFLRTLRDHDIATYGGAVAAAVRAAVTDLFPSLTVPVQVTVHLEWVNADTDTDDRWWAEWERGRLQAPLPSSGIPRDYPPAASIVEAERDAGRDPLARIQRTPT